jgi:ethanolamine-phosphate cytidylyltransferase
MMHYGHANALRQAKELGDYLIVGVHSDSEIEKNKGPPVMNEEERYLAVAACKWVDEVVRDAPYVTSLEMLNKYEIDYCVHGDDIVTSADGVDTYHEVKKAGRFKTVPRTRGVSTTDLVGRMLLMTKQHHDTGEIDKKEVGSMSEGKNKRSPYTGVSKFMTTNQKIVQFSKGIEPKSTDKIVYIDGTFVLFHIGHIEIL